MTQDPLRSAEKAAAIGDMERAFAQLTACAPGDDVHTEFWRYCDWLAAAGFIQEAEERLRAYHALSPRFVEASLLRLWTSYAVFDPRIVSEVIQFLTPRNGTTEVRRALRLLYFIEGASGRVLDQYRRVLADFVGTPRQRKAITADLISLSVGAGQVPDLAADITLHPNTLSLHLDRYFTQHGAGALCPKFAKRRADAFTGAIDRANTDIWAGIAARDARIAIVGNSPIEVGQGKGAEIDAHDIVIRFNVPKQDVAFARDYGVKTDIIVVNHSILQRLDIVSLRRQTLLMTGPDWESFTVNRKAAMQLIKQGNRIGMIPQAIRTRLTGALLGTASSGLQVCSAVSDARGGADGVGFYGFAMTDQIGASPTSANYFRQSRPVFRHNWIGEAAILDAIKTGAPWPDVRGKRYENHWGTRDMFRPKRFAILGDHADYHCGSAAVTRHLMDSLAPHGVVVADGDYDTLVVNGEGSMHHNSKAFVAKMEALRAAQDAGKETLLVNSVWQENDARFDDVLRKLDKIYVRELDSQNDMIKRHGITPTLYPDFAYYSRLDNAPTVTDFAGKMVCTDVYSREFETFVRWTGKKEAKFTYVDMQDFTWSELVASLQTAELLVTGRQHAVFAACRAEVPFIAFPGNTHKIEGLFAAAGVDIPMCTDKAKLNDLIRWARRNRAEYDKLFAWLKRQPAWFPGI